MDDSQRCKRWSHSEIEELLTIIKEKNIVQLMDGKHKRNKIIFESIAEELRLKSILRTVDQIKTKFKALKADYLKVKRHNNVSGNSRKECEHFALLDEILQNRPLTALSGIDTIEDELFSPIFNEELVEDTPVLAQNEPPSPAPSQISSPAPSRQVFSPVVSRSGSPAQNESPRSSTSVATSLNVFKTSQKRTYQRAISSFSNEGRKMQEDAVKRAREQEEELLEQMRIDDKRNIEALAAVLKEDREETMKAFKEILESLSK